MEYVDFFFFLVKLFKVKFKKKKREGNICINFFFVNCIFFFKKYWNFGIVILILKD